MSVAFTAASSLACKRLRSEMVRSAPSLITCIQVYSAPSLITCIYTAVGQLALVGDSDDDDIKL
jgi:hypothetical protein